MQGEGRRRAASCFSGRSSGLAHRKDPGLLIRESWVRIPPGPPGDRRILFRQHSPLARTSPRKPSGTMRTFPSAMNLQGVTLLTRRTNQRVCPVLVSARPSAGEVSCGAARSFPLGGALRFPAKREQACKCPLRTASYRFLHLLATHKREMGNCRRRRCAACRRRIEG